MDIDSSEAAVERRLDELQRESAARRDELRSLAEELPDVTSRRAMVRSMASSVVHTPDRRLVFKRVVLKIGRAPADLWRHLRTR